MRTMAEHKVRRLPLIDGRKLIDVVNQADLAKALPKEKAGELVVISSD
jgi:CBS-domain-containing membrane protein